MLSSNNQSLAPHNGCQEVVSKGGLDRFVKPFQTSIRLTFNTLEAHNKNQQLSRGSKQLNACQYLTGKISHFSGHTKTEVPISLDNTYKTKENHIKEMFLLIKTCHNVADYHRIIKFVIGGMEIVPAECRERHRLTTI